ncbi:MAG TPA: VWA domain-containing protein [Terriglobia bacterium]|nr:VWA domain-containing protein [Terriglobia bacterium]
MMALPSLRSRRLCLGRGALVLGVPVLFALATPARSPQAQQTANPPEVQSHETPPPFRIHAERNLVTVRVVVREPHGRTVGNLTKDDFRLLDNGKAEEISGFTVETKKPAAAPTAPTPAAVEVAPPAPAPAEPERFIGLFFDDLHLPIEGVQRTREAAWRYITTNTGPRDRVAIFTASHKDDLDFTDDRDKLHEALFRIAPRSRTIPQINDCPSIDEYEAYLIDQRRDRNATELAQYEAYYCDCIQTGNQTPACAMEAYHRVMYQSQRIWNLAVMQSQDSLERIAAAVERLAAMAGQRSLVLVSAGFLTLTRSADIDRIIDYALRKDVVISSIDAEGLVARTHQVFADIEHADFATRKDMLAGEGATYMRDVMSALADRTGGVFFHNNNDFNEGFHETAEVPEFAYVLSFSPANFQYDGKFHTLKVSLTTKEPRTLEARRGYFAPTQELAEQAPGQEQLDSLMFSRDEIHGLPVEVSAEVGSQTQPPATLTVVIHVDLRGLYFRKEADRSVNTLVLDTALFDSDGKYVSGKESSFDLRLTDATLQKFSTSGVYLKTSFSQPPGAYRVREVVRDVVEKQLSAVSFEVQVPSVSTAAPAAGAESALPPGMFVDLRTAELVKAVPELKHLQAAESQDPLPMILERVGANVAAFFDNFSNTTSSERVTSLIGNSYHLVESHYDDTFNYLALVQPGADVISIREFRTDSKGQVVAFDPRLVDAHRPTSEMVTTTDSKGEVVALPPRLADAHRPTSQMVTIGFVSMSVLFHPKNLGDSRFRYLGREEMKGQDAYVVAFAQRPGVARRPGLVKFRGKEGTVFVEGVAWIDPESFNILRLRTDIEQPELKVGLRKETTEVSYSAVTFKEGGKTLWLPQEVTVNGQLGEYNFQNHHYYSKYRLFIVKAEEKAKNP